MSETENNVETEIFISRRAETVSNWEDFLNKYLGICNNDEYEEQSNPNGYINLGTAVNNMCHDIILPRLTSKNVWYCDNSLLQYKEGYGIESLRKNMALLMTKFLDTHELINAENLICSVGVTSCIDLLIHCIADPGEVILAPTPIYPRIHTDFKQRCQVDLWPIPIICCDDSTENQQLTLEKVKNAYSNAILKGKVVKGIFLINPSNPLGDIYDSDLLMEILIFCKKHKLHVIIDEVYALSVFKESLPFHSVLKFSTLPDAERTHVLYGLSKDFGIAGLRIGVIYTKNEVLLRCLRQLSFFQNIPFLMMGIAAKLIEDLSWCEQYSEINMNRLSEKYEFCFLRLQEMGLTVRNSKAGFFAWVNFQMLCELDTFEQERKFFLYLLDKYHLYIVPGQEFFCQEPGWFRITFSSKPHHVSEGLQRLEKAIKTYKNSK